MKKILFVLAAACVTVAAQAKILRVSNVAGSSAPYTNIADAAGAAEDGDTIMVDASSTPYEDTELLGKRIVLIGPGYFLTENGITTSGASGASIGTLKVSGQGSVIKGMTITQVLVLLNSKIVVTRCRLAGPLQLGSNDSTKPAEAENCIIHQNFFNIGHITTYNWYKTSFMQFTNNIFYTGMSFGNMTNAYIAYNTFAGGLTCGVTNSTIEHNIASYLTLSIGATGSVETNNIKSDGYAKLDYAGQRLDAAYWELYQTTPEVDAGAFAGADPYVLSGIPSGPVIQDLVVPASVEKGSTMSVTVKVGVVK